MAQVLSPFGPETFRSAVECWVRSTVRQFFFGNSEWLNVEFREAHAETAHGFSLQQLRRSLTQLERNFTWARKHNQMCIINYGNSFRMFYVSMFSLHFCGKFASSAVCAFGGLIPKWKLQLIINTWPQHDSRTLGAGGLEGKMETGH